MKCSALGCGIVTGDKIAEIKGKVKRKVRKRSEE
jgi:hypothetical protein